MPAAKPRPCWTTSRPGRLRRPKQARAPLQSKAKELSMSIAADRKAEVIKTYATKSGDTGSPEVQVAILSERIANLTEHFKTHVKDNHSRRGLLKLVSQHPQPLDFLKRSHEGR